MNIEKDKILVVEGKDEFNFFQRYFRVHGVTDIQIMPIGGKTKLTENLGLLVNDDYFDSVSCVGIIRDADDDPQAALTSVKYSIDHYGFTSPTNHLQRFGVDPSWIILILPDISQTGALEDTLLFSVQADCAMPFVNQFYSDLNANGCQFPSKLNKSKTLCFLSSRTVYCNYIGLAAQNNVWNMNSPAFANIHNIIGQM